MKRRVLKAHWGALALTGSMVAVPLLLVPTAAHAAAPSAVPAPCVTKSDQKVPLARRAADTTDITPSLVASLEKQLLPEKKLLAREDARGGSTARAVPRSVVIPVRVHVIQGTHRGEKSVGKPQVARLVKILDGGFNHAQLAGSADTRYAFRLRGVNFKTKDSWYHAAPLSANDRAAKRHFHVGGPMTLNLYLNNARSSAGKVLGFSRFPWQYAGNHAQDGVTINVDSLPGHKETHYNLGDTAVHEVGHWMGLYHTFEGGCSATNDAVADTPAEGEPSYYCQVGRDTCPTAGADPVTNFMDYSYDSCMRQFSPGQVRRMDAAFSKWRYL